MSVRRLLQRDLFPIRELPRSFASGSLTVAAIVPISFVAYTYKFSWDNLRRNRCNFLVLVKISTCNDLTLISHRVMLDSQKVHVARGQALSSFDHLTLTVEGLPKDRGTQRIVSVNYLFGRPLIPSDFLERIVASNTRGMANLMSVVFGWLKMSFWVP